ncbi:MAG: TlyA family rRNA (cytidine-2'-O)-methyltransferase [Chloroflexota bacterium]
MQHGLVESRERAQALILAGDVRVNGVVVTKPAQLVPEDAEIEAGTASLPYVSRGGLKLQHALDTFGIDVRGLVALDVGASTGGFTDCLLQRGAARVYAIDVGYGQLAWKLRQDPRVVVLERTNIRYLERLPDGALADLATVDVSFISLTKVLPAVLRLLKPDGFLIALVKPQFEAGPQRVGRGGVVRDPAVHREVLQQIISWAQEYGLVVRGLTRSPILGPAGNVEFLLWLDRRRDAPGIDVAQAIEDVVRRSPADARSVAASPPGPTSGETRTPAASQDKSGCSEYHTGTQTHPTRSIQHLAGLCSREKRSEYAASQHLSGSACCLAF